MKLYSIFYTGDICGNPKTFEGVTDNFKKWLEEHNKDRVKENGEEDPDFAEDWEEGADNFEVEEVALSLYNEENTDDKNTTKNY